MTAPTHCGVCSSSMAADLSHRERTLARRRAGIEVDQGKPYNCTGPPGYSGDPVEKAAAG